MEELKENTSKLFKSVPLTGDEDRMRKKEK